MVDEPVGLVPPMDREVLLGQREGRDKAPLGRHEFGNIVFDDARLADEQLQVEGLPAVGVGERGVARFGGLHRLVERAIGDTRVVIGLV